MDVNVMVTKEIKANVAACSIFAIHHQPRQRDRLCGVGSKVKLAVTGAAVSWPVIGLTRRGT